MGKKNKHIPFTICDRCIAIREAKKNNEPNLKIVIRRKYRLKCCHCNELLGCPAYAIRINKETPPMCDDCVSDLASPDDYSPEDDSWGPDEFLGGF